MHNRWHIDVQQIHICMIIVRDMLARSGDSGCSQKSTWWRHQMGTFSALLAICAGNSPAPGEFPAQKPVTRSFEVFFDLCLNKRLSKQSWEWWFETLPRPLWRQCNEEGLKMSYDNYYLRWLLYCSLLTWTQVIHKCYWIHSTTLCFSTSFVNSYYWSKGSGVLLC